MYANGTCENFATEKKHIDTHVCLALSISMMGEFKPSEQPIALDRPNKEDLERMQAQRIRQLEREVNQLRGKS